MSTKEVQAKWERTNIRNWSEIYSQLRIFFSEIMEKYTKLKVVYSLIYGPVEYKMFDIETLIMLFYPSILYRVSFAKYAVAFFSISLSYFRILFSTFNCLSSDNNSCCENLLLFLD